jgi:taurine transport system permease protein
MASRLQPIPARKDMLTWNQARSITLSLLTIVILIFLWWFLTSGIRVVKPLYFPSPSSVLQTLVRIHQKIWLHAGATLARVIVSWSLGCCLGVVVGLIMVRSQVTKAVLSPVVEGLRPVPPVALIPLVIVWFGIGENGKIFLSGLACFMVLAVNTIVSAGNVSPIYIQAAKSLGASENQIYSTIILPAIVPELLSGGRIAIALAFAVTVAAEFMGAEYGIGYLIMQASRTLNTEVVLIGTFVIGVESFVIDRLLRSGTNYITRWSERL